MPELMQEIDAMAERLRADPFDAPYPPSQMELAAADLLLRCKSALTAHENALKLSLANTDEALGYAEQLKSALARNEKDHEDAEWFRWWIPHAAEETGLRPERIMDGLRACRYEHAKEADKSKAGGLPP